MSQELLNVLWDLLVGSAGASVVVAFLMEYVKSVWKPEPNWQYWLVAIPLSAASVGIIFWYLSFWNLLIFVASTAVVAFAELMENNKAWPYIKKGFFLLVKRLGKK